VIGPLRRLFGRRETAEGPRVRKGPRGFDAPLEIDRPTYAVGDVHGRFDQLERLLARIAEDAAARALQAPRLVLMGDYVDRGEQSAEVLSRVQGLLRRPEGAGFGEVIALRGNHEAMMLEFLEEPTRGGPRWLRNGGLQTMLSFGVGGVQLSSEGEELEAAAERLAAAAGGLTEMLRALPSWTRHGNVLFAHAGGDPETPPELQGESTLIWGTPRFFQHARSDGLWCVHGHYVVDEASAAQGRISIDTGAYATGVLSAVRLEEDRAEFLTSVD
jgi:serine/threonine protein phosphatase 1